MCIKQETILVILEIDKVIFINKDKNTSI